MPEAAIISVNGVDLEVFEAGRENAGNPIVLCHGWPDLAYTWRFQIPVLVAAGYHVIAPNQRGFGNSTKPEDIVGYDIEHLADDLAALLDYFGYDPIIHQPALMIYGLRDAVTRSEQLFSFVPNVEELSLDSGHWVHQELHSETTSAVIEWLARNQTS